MKDTALLATLSGQSLLSINNKNDLGKIDNAFKKNALSTEIVTLLASTASVQASAEESHIATEKEVEKITVTGIRGALGRALDTKREASWCR